MNNIYKFIKRPNLSIFIEGSFILKKIKLRTQISKINNWSNT